MCLVEAAAFENLDKNLRTFSPWLFLMGLKENEESYPRLHLQAEKGCQHDYATSVRDVLSAASK